MFGKDLSVYEQHSIDVVSNHLTPANATAKNAHQTLVLREMKPPSKYRKNFSRKNIHPQALCLLPLKVTVENELRHFQFKVIHNILPPNNLK